MNDLSLLLPHSALCLMNLPQREKNPPRKRLNFKGVSRENSCDGKKKFPARASAARACQLIERDWVRAYPCRFCHGWHLTSAMSSSVPASAWRGPRHNPRREACLETTF